MLLGRVAGTVVMTVKHKAYAGQTLLAVDLLDEAGERSGQSLLALDRAQAGVGDTVLVMREGSGIRQMFGRDEGVPIDEAIKGARPVRSVIIAVVDAVHVPGFGEAAS
jgi:ethanolamine utilization protein EutN